MKSFIRIGVDLAKNAFQVHGCIPAETLDYRNIGPVLSYSFNLLSTDQAHGTGLQETPNPELNVIGLPRNATDPPEVSAYTFQ